MFNPWLLVNPYRELETRDGISFQAFGKCAGLFLVGSRLERIGRDAGCQEQDTSGGNEELHGGIFVLN